MLGKVLRAEAGDEVIMSQSLNRYCRDTRNQPGPGPDLPVLPFCVCFYYGHVSSSRPANSQLLRVVRLNVFFGVPS
jgi:hypothetical protein